MKTPCPNLWKPAFLAVFLMLNLLSRGQGRVVINEYMPWTPSGCGPTADFVELMNFGPGPVNIGCYILTDGDHAITIPANTVLQVGEYYLISGQDILTYPCANIDSTVHVDLNWNSCGCTSGPIPTTGDGFLTDGGSANEQLVLMDPNLNVVDAVARALPVEPSATIITSAAGGGCLPREFDLDLMAINYETIGESAGRGNSFARKLDGDCGWLKDPQQSGNATNNTPGDASNVSYKLTVTNSMACPYGSVSITVTAASYSDIFPMTYTLAYDSNKNNSFDVGDYYSVGTDPTPNTIPIGNLSAGLYRVTLASAKGCNLQTFEFRILDCFPVLPARIIHFGSEIRNDRLLINWQIVNHELVSGIELQRSAEGNDFKGTPVGVANSTDVSVHYRQETEWDPALPFVRLMLSSADGRVIFSPVIDLRIYSRTSFTIFPNPVKDELHISFPSFSQVSAACNIIDPQGRAIAGSHHLIGVGINHLSLPVKGLPRGTYYLILTNSKQGEVLLRAPFIKN